MHGEEEDGDDVLEGETEKKRIESRESITLALPSLSPSSSTSSTSSRSRLTINPLMVSVDDHIRDDGK